MAFSRRIFLVVLVAVSVTTAIALLILDLQDRAIVLNSLRAKALSIAVTAAAGVDGDLHQDAIESGKEAGESYKELASQLRRIRDLNRRDDTLVQFLYTLYQDPKDKQVYRFGIDPEESAQDHSTLGQVYRKSGESIRFEEAYAEEGLNVDQWGRWITAYAPILDSEGKTVATLAVDIPWNRLAEAWKRSARGLALALAVGLLAAWCFSAFLARMVRGPLSEIQRMAKEIGAGNFAVQSSLKRSDEFGVVSASLLDMCKALAERDRIKGAFARFVSQQVMDTVLADGDAPTVHGKRRRITVMFCDIRGFTALSELLAPEEVVTLLNEYFDLMVEIVFKYQGTLDKFIGDGLMIIFGAPGDDPYQEEHAVRAALEMRRATRELSERWERERGISLKIGIGIHSGNAVVGNIGSSIRMEYTAIGDTVNLASRLESATKKHAVDILMSEFTYHSVRGLFDVEPLGTVSVPGREEAVTAYAVQGAVGRDTVGPVC